MYVYTANNLCIHSEICLPELVVSEGTPEIVIRLGKLHNLPQESSGRGNRFLGELRGVGRFLIEGGREIVVEPISGIDESMLRPSILGPAMSVVLRQRGLLVLHASSVAINHTAVAFLGSSGWGKSTIAQTFHAQGYDILTDDVMAVETSRPHPIVFPGFPQLKLSPEAAASMGGDSKCLSPLFPNAEKLSYAFTGGFQNTPLPLERIYVLANGTYHDITQLPPQAAFTELVRHTRAIHLLKAPEFIHSHLRQCSSLIRNVSSCRLSRQISLEALPELVKLVKEDLANTASCETQFRA